MIDFYKWPKKIIFRSIKTNSLQAVKLNIKLYSPSNLSMIMHCIVKIFLFFINCPPKLDCRVYEALPLIKFCHFCQTVTLNLAICLRIPSDSNILYADETLLHFCLQFYSISFFFFFNNWDSLHARLNSHYYEV